MPRLHRHKPDDGSSKEPEPTASAAVHLDEEQLRDLTAVFAAPRWLRDLGVASWLLGGAILLLVGVIWLVGATSVITLPVIAAFVIAAVASPIVNWLVRHRVGRTGAALLVLLLLLAVGVVIGLLVIGGITSQADEIQSAASQAADKAEQWLKDAGINTSGASSTTDSASEGSSQTISKLAKGVATGISDLTSLLLGLSFMLLSLLFLLKDGPGLRRWVERHMGVPQPVARTITSDVLTAVRGYFAGVTIVAAFNGIVVGLAALLLGVPLAGTIAVVTFVCAYIPYVGAFVAGAFAVVIALGTEGTTTAVIMLVVVLLANGTLQQILQPIAYGATLGLNPLVVLIVTIGAGALFGMVGLVLAAPLTSAAVHISADLARARPGAPPRDEEAEAPLPPEPGQPEPAPG